MKRGKKWLLGITAPVVASAIGAAAFALFEVTAFDASVSKDYRIPALDIQAVDDPAVIARGEHLAMSVGGCLECHGSDLGGRRGEDLGPVGVVRAPNLTKGKGGVGNRYSDGQLARLLRHGVRASGKSLLFMPAQDISWWPDDDLQAMVSYLRSVPPVDRTLGKTRIFLLGKLLDRLDLFPLDVARRIDHAAARPQTLPAQPTAEYGALLARSCTGCHGEHFSGGPIPGAPELPVPANITPHDTGLKTMTEADWTRLLELGIKHDGRPLNPFMPVKVLRALDATERSALWKFLRALPPRPFGGR